MVLVKFEGNVVERATKLDVFDPSSRTNALAKSRRKAIYIS